MRDKNDTFKATVASTHTYTHEHRHTSTQTSKIHEDNKDTDSLVKCKKKIVI